ncbi:hypothetical protein FJZ26_04680, partial [Candidatus Parvarchaeota archaeon]|nr:hypothetical protein [Candidatus Parvarchaeota archaeon]
LAKSSHNPSSLPQGVSLHNAGHILGSTQILVETKQERFVYTGDLKTEDCLIVRGAAPIECDTLVIEGTYANPQARFEQRNEVYQQMAYWVEKSFAASNLLFGAYAIGKAQELVKFLNTYCKITPVVDGDIARACQVYKSNGIALEWADASSQQGQQALEGDFVAIVPQSRIGGGIAKKLEAAHGAPIKTAVATGWAATRKFGTDAAFALSDHADYNQLVEYVLACKAKKVYCTHGNEQLFARELRKLGIDAHAAPGRQSSEKQEKEQPLQSTLESWSESGSEGACSCGENTQRSQALVLAQATGGARKTWHGL